MAPERLGHYRILEEIGSGGMGIVYLARTGEEIDGAKVGDRVALKVVHSYLLTRPGYYSRFLREVEAGKAVRHENVVRTLDVGSLSDGESTTRYLVMEYVEGRTLRQLLSELGTLPEALVREVARQIAGRHPR